MPPRRVSWRHTVEGAGRFPIDMLRFDACIPATEGDSGQITRTFDRHERGPHRVTVESRKAELTTARWASFGWKVVQVPERDKTALVLASILTDSPVPDTSQPGISLGLQPVGVRKAQWQGLQAIIDFLYVTVIERLDWNRVLLSAGSVHRERVEKDSSHATDDAMLGGGMDEEDPICPACIIDCLLSESTVAILDVVEEPPERHPLWRKDWLEEADGAEAILKVLAPLILQAARNGRLEPAPDEYEKEDE